MSIEKWDVLPSSLCAAITPYQEDADIPACPTVTLPITMQLRRHAPKKYAISSSVGNVFPSMIMLFPHSIPSNEELSKEDASDNREKIAHVLGHDR